MWAPCQQNSSAHVFGSVIGNSSPKKRAVHCSLQCPSRPRTRRRRLRPLRMAARKLCNAQTRTPSDKPSMRLRRPSVPSQNPLHCTRAQRTYVWAGCQSHAMPIGSPPTVWHLSSDRSASSSCRSSPPRPSCATSTMWARCAPPRMSAATGFSAARALGGATLASGRRNQSGNRAAARRARRTFAATTAPSSGRLRTARRSTRPATTCDCRSATGATARRASTCAPGRPLTSFTTSWNGPTISCSSSPPPSLPSHSWTRW